MPQNGDFFSGYVPKGQQPLDPYLKLHNKANSNTLPATFKRGIINTIHPNGTADVQVVGNQSTILKGIYFSSAVNPVTVRPGDKCRIDMFSEINPSDSIIAYTYGRQQQSLASWGYATLPDGNHQQVSHGLPGIPNIISVSTFPAGTSAGVEAPFAWVSLTAPPADNNYIYVDVYASGSYTFYWAAAIV